MRNMRMYNREVVNLACTFYALSRFELPAKLLNLSESGVLLELNPNNALYRSLQVGDNVIFQSIDYLEGGKFYIFQESSEVVRIEKTGSSLLVACKVSMTDSKYKQYIDSLRKFRS